MKHSVEILIVEDSLTQAEKLKFLLEENGYAVSMAGNGKDALAAMKERRPALVVSDILMPVMDGYALCRTIKGDKALRDVPVILLTTLSDPEDIIRGLEVGANGYCTKPYDGDLLLSRIDFLLANPVQQRSEAAEERLEVTVAGNHHVVTSSRREILDLLLSTYESAVRQNRELVETQLELRKLNEELEDRVEVRTRDLWESESKYRSLFDNMINGVALHEVLTDADNQPVDLIYVDVNESLEVYGLKKEEVVGKKVTEVIPEIKNVEPDLISIYGEVALTGESRQLEFYFEPFDRWYSVSAYSPQKNYVATVSEDITERKKTEEQIQASLYEKEVLLKEVHHRVKNNLQFIASLLSMQARRIADPASLEVFVNSQSRVHSMALIHERLYKSDSLAEIDFEDYVRMLVKDLLASHVVQPEAIRVDVDMDRIPLKLDAAVPCGLIVNELVTNALKHAFPDGRRGTIRIGFNQTNGVFVLAVRDDGAGLPEDAETRKTTSLGLRLVQILTEQLEGDIALQSDGRGTEAIITFPAPGSGESVDHGQI